MAIAIPFEDKSQCALLRRRKIRFAVDNSKLEFAGLVDFKILVVLE